MYRFRDDIPNKLAAFERLVHDYENQSTMTVDDDIKIGVTMLGMEDMRVKEHLIRNSVRITSWNQMREETRDHANTTVHRQSTDANAARSESEEQKKRQKQQRQGRQGRRRGQGWKERIVQEGKERRSDDQGKWFYCNKSGHVKAERRKRQKDLANAEEKPVAASPHPHDTAAVVPLQCLLPGERHTSTFVIALPCANSETSCESSSEGSVMSPGAGSIAPEEMEHTRLLAAIPSCETCLIMDTCAGGSIFQEVLIRVPRTIRRWHRCNSRR